MMSCTMTRQPIQQRGTTDVQGLTVTTNERLVFFVNFLGYLKDLAAPGLEELKEDLGRMVR